LTVIQFKIVMTWTFIGLQQQPICLLNSVFVRGGHAKWRDWVHGEIG